MPSHGHTEGIAYAIVSTTSRRFAQAGDEGSLLASVEALASTGGSKPHNNMPQSIAMPLWHRTG